MHAPTLAALKTARPDWQITVWVAPRGTQELAENDPNVDAVIEAPIKATPWQHLRTLRTLRAHHFDIGLVLSPGQLEKSALYLWLAGIPKRVGHTYPSGSKPHSRRWLTHTIDEDESIHDIEQNLRLLRLLDIAPPAVTHYSLAIPETTKKAATEIMQKLGVPLDKTLIGFHVGSAPTFIWKRWPVEYFLEVARSLIKNDNAHILLFSGPGEEESSQRLDEQLDADSTVISTNLLTTAAIMHECQLLLTNDSGLMHLAAAVDVPTLGLFGPTSEHHTGPRGAHSRAIRTPQSQPEYHTERMPDLGLQTHLSLQQLTPQHVLNEIEKIM